MTTIELYGDPLSDDIRATADRLMRYGYDVEISPGPDHHTGLGPCGKHQCNCQVSCEGFQVGDLVTVLVHMPYNTKPEPYPGTILERTRPDFGEERPRYTVELMDGRVIYGCDSLVMRKR